MESIPNKHGPCLDKNCGFCCDPVRVSAKAQGQPPTDKKGKVIFRDRYEVFAPLNRIDTERIKTYDCVNFDSVTKKCFDHENRPDLCRNSSCITDTSADIDEQHAKTIEETFVPITIHRK